MRYLALLLFASMLFVSINGISQEEEEIEISVNEPSKEGEWGGIPGMNENGIALTNQTSFFIVMGAAATSYLIAKYADKDSTLNYFHSRFGLFGVSNRTTITMQTFGLEKRMSHWYGIGLEANLQQWKTRIPSNSSGLGIGLNTYYRWHILGKRKLSPYLEYGAGVFYGFRPLPYDGTNFTFHLTTALGVEYRLANQNKIRVSYGHLHQSNNDLLPRNPGLDGGGLQVSFLWYAGKAKR